MMNWELAKYCFLTLAVGLVVGRAFKMPKVPAGWMIGSFAGAALLACSFDAAWMPSSTRTVAQVIAGAYVGCSMERDDIRRLRVIFRPTLMMLASFFTLMIAAGVTIYFVSPLDLKTSLMCAMPAGVNDTPIIAADMGADVPSVTVLQLVRQIFGIAVLPSLVVAYDRYKTSCGHVGQRSEQAHVRSTPRNVSHQRSLVSTMAVLSAAALAGLLGQATHIPGMTFTFAIAAALVMKLGFDFAYIPRWVRKACQVIAGCYLGSLMTVEQLSATHTLIVPILVVVAFYAANCIVTGTLQRRFFGYGRTEGMMIETPAGAADMALILEDLKIRNTDIIVMHVVRATTVIGLFPQVVNLICHLWQ